jgi:spore coat protein U-like protein
MHDFRIHRPTNVALAALVALAGMIIPTFEAAANDTAILSVSASIDAGCTVTGGTLEFNVVNPSMGRFADGSFTVECASVASLSITLSGGNAATASTRRMERVGGGGHLEYALFKDVNRTLAWGNGAFGTAHVVDVTTAGTPQTVTVFGSIPNNQGSPPAGEYTDSVTITISPS